MPAKAKYKDLKPKIAKILDVKTINESVVIAKIAGIESIAKITSVNSTAMRVRNSGVMWVLPFSFIKNLPFSLLLLMG